MTDRHTRFGQVVYDDRLQHFLVGCFSRLHRIHSGRNEHPLGKCPARRLNALPRSNLVDDEKKSLDQRSKTSEEIDLYYIPTQIEIQPRSGVCGGKIEGFGISPPCRRLWRLHTLDLAGAEMTLEARYMKLKWQRLDPTMMVRLNHHGEPMSDKDAADIWHDPLAGCRHPCLNYALGWGVTESMEYIDEE